MIVLVAQHPVADYDAWKAVYDEANPGTFGARFARLNRAVDDPNLLAIVMGFDSVEAAQAMMHNPDLKAAMGRAGVTAAPRFEMYEEVESVQY